jgi:signal transduction histidine kinase/DNA-binding response OmpR family regulator
MAVSLSAAGEPAATAERSAVLVVDDLPEKLLVMRTVLESLDADIVLAHSGADALRELLRREFAVVLLDVNMPDIDGFETASLIRTYKQTAHTPIIFVTAYVDDMQAAHGYSLGAVDYIVSPVVPDILRGKVRVFLDLAAARQRLREQAEERIALVAAQAARDAAEANSRRLGFLAQVGHVLAGSLEDGTALSPLLAFMQRELGGVAALAIGLDDARRVHVAGIALPAADALAWKSIPGVLAEPLARAAVPGARRIDLDAASLAALDEMMRRCSDRDHAALPRLSDGCALPLAVGPRQLGALVVAVPARTPMWDALEEVAYRLAMALENDHLVQELRQEVAVRSAAELRMADANRRKDEFLAMLSHELRNPLAPIRSAAEVVRLAGGSNPKLEWASAVVSRQVDSLRRLIDELLDVARISQGKVVLNPETLDLRSVVTQAVETVKPMLDARRHALQVLLPEQRVWLRGDAGRLLQVVANLLTNAAKYTDEGGQIVLTLVVQDGQAEVRVRDNGIGIDAELLPRIFDMFEQGRRGLDRSQGGLGVGLTLAQRLVAMHHGSIEAHSAGSGQGAEFVVRLPALADVAERDETAGRDVSASAPRPLRVLVVDDNRDAAETTAIVLSLAGHDVHSAADGTEALGLAAIHAPEVVVLDLGLPGIDGYEVAARLREMPAGRDAMLIALTGYGGERDRKRVREAGFDLHLVKPADPQDIARAIEQRARATDTAATTPSAHTSPRP